MIRFTVSAPRPAVPRLPGLRARRTQWRRADKMAMLVDALCRMAVADGAADAGKAGAIVAIIRDMTGQDVPSDRVRHGIVALQIDRHPLDADAVAIQLPGDQRRLLLRALIRLAATTGRPLTDAEGALIRRYARAFGIDGDEIRTLLREAAGVNRPAS